MALQGTTCLLLILQCMLRRKKRRDRRGAKSESRGTESRWGNLDEEKENYREKKMHLQGNKEQTDVGKMRGNRG